MPRAFWRVRPIWNVPGLSCACPRHGGPVVHRVRRCRPRSAAARGGRRQGGFAFGDEDVGRVGVITQQLAQPPQFRAAQRMGARQAVLAPAHMQKPLPQIHLLAAQDDQLRDAQPVTVGEQDHGSVAVAVAPELARRGDQPVDLGTRQVLPAASLDVGLLQRRSHGERLSRKRGLPRRPSAARA